MSVMVQKPYAIDLVVLQSPRAVESYRIERIPVASCLLSREQREFDGAVDFALVPDAS